MTARSHVQVLENNTNRFLRRALEAMVQEVTLLRRRDEASRRTIMEYREQMRSAATIQRDLLPSTLPKVAGLDVHLVFRPADALSGDLYNVVRIDETHIGISLADATGHGLPGGVLATFLCRSLCGGHVRNGSKRSLQPDEVLRRVNRDLLDAGFTDCPFVTALNAVYHEPTRTLTWARGGAPYPILVQHGELPRQIISQGPLVGAIEHSEFEVTSLTLQPGAIIVLHTDGLEALLCDRRTEHGRYDLANSEWFQRLGEQELVRQIEDLEARLDSISKSDWYVDDVTVIALHAREQ